ncbi:MAG: methyltransferase [Chitinophagaceae bacterium]|nr:methyltransferase [Chitinophagaceae bacterium]
MSNNWFQFKQFRIDQGQCAMKVTTDACIQGAWTPLPKKTKRILDIGTGTGLLALMMAQRTENTLIDAVEYDATAAEQAKENVSHSPWSNRITVQCNDIRAYDSSEKYDAIICNPPFFDNALLGPKHEKNTARHTIALTKEELAMAVVKHLSPEGHVSILLPVPEYRYWLNVAEGYGLFPRAILLIRHRPGSEAKRIVAIMSLSNTGYGAVEHQLTIMQEDGTYTEQFREMLRPFYLNIP